jgi:hypothetical protein
VGEGGAHGIRGGAFVAAVAPGVEEADGDGVHLLGAEGGDGGGQRGLVEGERDAAIGAEALAQGQAEAAGDQGGLRGEAVLSEELSCQEDELFCQECRDMRG